MLGDLEGSGFGVEGCWLRLALGVSGLDVWLSQNMCFCWDDPCHNVYVAAGLLFRFGDMKGPQI